MKLGLAFPPDSIDQWHSLFASRSRNKLFELTIHSCPTYEDLKACRPAIIAAHISDDLIRYLRDAPDSLEWVHVMSAGVDRLFASMPKESFAFRVTNVRGIHQAAIAEFVLAGMLHFEKKIPRLMQQQEEQRWNRFSLPLLRGKSMLVLGTGAVGSAIARMGAGLDLQIVGVSRTGEFKEPFDKVVTLRSLATELPRADYAVLALPLTPLTRGIMGKNEISLMKRGAVMINVSRGALVCEDSLVAALGTGSLGGAVLDAFSIEPLPEESALWRTRNLLLTPHIAGKFEGGRLRGVELFEQNLEAFLNERELLTEVDPQHGY